MADPHRPEPQQPPADTSSNPKGETRNPSPSSPPVSQDELDIDQAPTEEQPIGDPPTNAGGKTVNNPDVGPTS